jgi:hypothetical protein
LVSQGPIFEEFSSALPCVYEEMMVEMWVAMAKTGFADTGYGCRFCTLIGDLLV